MKKLFFSFIFLSFFIAGCSPSENRLESPAHETVDESSDSVSSLNEEESAEAFQRDADIIRLQHLKYYGEIIEEYYEKNGHYPLQGDSELPIYVLIANDVQHEQTEQPIPYEHERYSLPEFFGVLEEGLGRELNEYYDPQFFRNNVRPTFYVYLMEGETYYFAIHTQTHYPFSNELTEGYNKIEISNLSKTEFPEYFGYQFDALMEDPDFIEAVNAEVSKPGFFDERASEYLHYSDTLHE